MIRTIASILVTFLLIFGFSWYEMYYVNQTFSVFQERLESLYEKVENKTASFDDGKALQTFWHGKTRTLHIWLPHNTLDEVDYQMTEAIGYLYLQQYDEALPKIQVLIGIAEKLPNSYSLQVQNIL